MIHPESEIHTIRIPFDSLTLRAVVSELRARLIGGQIQDIRQPAPSDLRLGIRNQGRNYWLAISDDARFARVHLTSRKSPNASSPPTFCMTLRKYAEGCAITAVRQRGFDRIFELEIASHQENGERTTVTLITELMGKHSNIILVNHNKTILDAAKRISRRINRYREVLPGLPYQPPPEQANKIDPFLPEATIPLLAETAANPNLSADALTDTISRLYEGMSPFLAREIVSRIMQLSSPEGSKPQADCINPVWSDLFGKAAHNIYQPVAFRIAGGITGAYPFPMQHLPSEMQQAVQDFNAALDDAYALQEERADYHQIHTELRGQIDRDIKRFTRRREAADRALEEAERADQQKQIGELLLANLWKIEPQAREVVVQDYFSPEYANRVITLDPQLSPQENAEVYFRRYRKQRDGLESAQKRKNEAESRLERLNEAKHRIQSIENSIDGTVEAIRTLRALLQKDGFLQEEGEEGKGAQPGQSGPDFQGHKIRRVLTEEGYEIYIGETATANDFLTSRLAAPNDLWLHVRASASAHVIIRTQGKPEQVPRSVLEQAALLCARHSSQKHSALVPVDYTLKKYVRKPRGAAPGSADYHHETTLHVTP